MTHYYILIAALACLLNLISEQKGQVWVAGMYKIIASGAIVIYGLKVLPGFGGYDQLMVLGLLACFVGDVFLIPKNHKPVFLMGMLFFLLAHLCYATAFWHTGFASSRLPLVAPLVLLAMIGTLLWLRTHLVGVFKVAVPVYVLAIGGMCLLAATNQSTTNLWTIIAGAVIFALSDLFVARNRFVAPGMINRWIGLPLYYVAQFILASTVG